MRWPSGAVKSRVSMDPDRSTSSIRSRADSILVIGSSTQTGRVAAETRRIQTSGASSHWNQFRPAMTDPRPASRPDRATRRLKNGTRTDSRCSAYAGSSHRSRSGSGSTARSQGNSSSSMSYACRRSGGGCLEVRFCLAAKRLKRTQKCRYVVRAATRSGGRPLLAGRQRQSFLATKMHKNAQKSRCVGDAATRPGGRPIARRVKDGAVSDGLELM